MTLEQIEMLHEMGRMPDYAYYAQNGKSIQQNYNEQTRRFRKKCYAKMFEQDLEQALESEIDSVVEQLLDSFGQK